MNKTKKEDELRLDAERTQKKGKEGITRRKTISKEEGEYLEEKGGRRIKEEKMKEGSVREGYGEEVFMNLKLYYCKC